MAFISDLVAIKLRGGKYEVIDQLRDPTLTINPIIDYEKFLNILLFLLCLAPIPAPFRYWFELRAYRTQLMFSFQTDKASEEQMELVYSWIEKQMTTSLYYWTWPFPKMIRKHLKDESSWSKGIHKFVINWISIRDMLKNKTHR